MTETETEGRSVEYGAVVFDELPPAPIRKGGGGAESVFDKLLDDVHGDKSKFNKPVSIGRYKNETAAKAAKNVLQQRNGRNIGVSGHEFHVRPIEDAAGSVVWNLFVIYNPKAVVDGAWDEHQAFEAKRIANIEVKRAEREAAKAAAETNGEGSPAE